MESIHTEDSDRLRLTEKHIQIMWAVHVEVIPFQLRVHLQQV